MGKNESCRKSVIMNVYAVLGLLLTMVSIVCVCVCVWCIRDLKIILLKRVLLCCHINWIWQPVCFVAFLVQTLQASYPPSHRQKRVTVPTHLCLPLLFLSPPHPHYFYQTTNLWTLHTTQLLIHWVRRHRSPHFTHICFRLIKGLLYNLRASLCHPDIRSSRAGVGNSVQKAWVETFRFKSQSYLTSHTYTLFALYFSLHFALTTLFIVCVCIDCVALQ